MNQARDRAKPPSHRAPAGRRRPTLKDIADEAGVSMALVSMIIAGKPGPRAATAARVLEVADRLGYRTNRTASQLASSRTHLLGVTMTPGNPYHGEMIEEILDTADARGYDLVIAAVTRTRDERRAIETLVDSNCEALLLLGSMLATPELLTAVGPVPTVSVGRPCDDPGVDVVRSADSESMELLVDHLASLGHTKIAHVDGGEYDLPVERRLGYERAMRARGLKPLVIPGGETEESGAAAAVEVMRRRSLTAVVAYNDLCAVGVMDHLQRHGIRIPEDLSIVGFDDDRLSSLAGIDLTTIDPSKLDQARVAVQAAIERAEGTRTQRIVYVADASLTIRGSTATPRPKGGAGTDPHPPRPRRAAAV